LRLTMDDDRAEFIVRRLNPEFRDAQIAFIHDDLALREAAGTWVGFSKPSDSGSRR